MRGVARWGVLALFAAPALASLGLSDLVKRWAQRRPVASVAISGVMLIGLCLEYNQTPTPALPGQPFTQPLAPVYEWLKTHYIVFIDVLDAAGKNRADLNGPPDLRMECRGMGA